LLPELKQILNDYRRYVYELQFGEVPEGQERMINNKQQEAVDKSYEFEQKAAEIQQEELTEEKVKDGVKKLELMRPVNNYGNTGSISIIQVLAIIIGVSIILTAVTLYLLG
jgi:F0F1-type ATP synthase alpha subunit